jgi:hypothetical protein
MGLNLSNGKGDQFIDNVNNAISNQTEIIGVYKDAMVSLKPLIIKFTKGLDKVLERENKSFISRKRIKIIELNGELKVNEIRKSDLDIKIKADKARIETLVNRIEKMKTRLSEKEKDHFRNDNGMFSYMKFPKGFKENTSQKFRDEILALERELENEIKLNITKGYEIEYTRLDTKTDVLRIEIDAAKEELNALEEYLNDIKEK